MDYASFRSLVDQTKQELYKEAGFVSGVMDAGRAAATALRPGYEAAAQNIGNRLIPRAGSLAAAGANHAQALSVGKTALKAGAAIGAAGLGTGYIAGNQR